MVFDNFIRLLKAKGFVLLFGRGTSFYRWNCKLADRGLTFKEEVVFNKGNGCEPFSVFKRIHETISIHGKGKIRKSRIPYMEKRQFCLKKLKHDLEMIAGAVKNFDKLQNIQRYLDTGEVEYTDRVLPVKASVVDRELIKPERYLSGVMVINNGFCEQSIIETSEHFNRQHPNQKPVRLIERLILITSASEGDIILDAFMGSGTTGVACERLNRRFIGIEREQAYFDIACKRIEAETKQAKLNLKEA
ncbi:MAG: site-specific DNA-methyltransferase [Elusimicrobiota bacterium]|nr:site-specific DNA-methyltransferase [Elusimicrobiota bacterium]